MSGPNTIRATIISDGITTSGEGKIDDASAVVWKRATLTLEGRDGGFITVMEYRNGGFLLTAEEITRAQPTMACCRSWRADELEEAERYPFGANTYRNNNN